MRDQIINASIESLRQEGLKFSVDTLCNKLKISKKTVYKYFPDKEALAIAMFEKYFNEAVERASSLNTLNTEEAHIELLKIYFDSKLMTAAGIFNKYKLNRSILDLTIIKSDLLWETIAMSFCHDESGTEKDALRIIVDGTMEKLCGLKGFPQERREDVIRKLVILIW